MTLEKPQFPPLPQVIAEKMCFWMRQAPHLGVFPAAFYPLRNHVGQGVYCQSSDVARGPIFARIAAHLPDLACDMA